MVLIILLFVLIIFLLIILSWVWPPDSPWAPWWRTDKKTALAICKLAGIKKEDTFYDLGCGDAQVLITAAQKFGTSGVGIEIDPLRFIIAKLRISFGGVFDRVKIKRANFLKEDISEASVVIVYLVPQALQKLLPKFKKELKKGTRIVSFRYDIDGLKIKKMDKENNLRLYVI